MIAQSQSGTGKTAAFVLTMLSRVDSSKPYPQVCTPYSAIVSSPERSALRVSFCDLWITHKTCLTKPNSPLLSSLTKLKLRI